jgi:hypothetical protein
MIDGQLVKKTNIIVHSLINDLNHFYLHSSKQHSDLKNVRTLYPTGPWQHLVERHVPQVFVALVLVFYTRILVPVHTRVIV